VTQFDPFDYTFHEDPYSVYEWLRAESPVDHNEARDLWALSRFEDVQAALRDATIFSSAEGVSFEADHAMWQFLPPPGCFIELDPPQHGEIRGTIRGFFSPRVMAAHEPRIRAIVQSAVAELKTRGGGDLVPDFAQHIPVTVIGELLGIPVADRVPMVGWADEMHARLPGDNHIVPEGIEAGIKLRSKFAELITARRAEPQSDIITNLTQVTLGDAGLRDEDINGIAFLVFLAGHDTTTQLLAHSLVYLNRDVELRASLSADPTRIPAVVEEFLRLESPVSMLARVTTREVEIHGKVIPPGSRVLMLYGAANRDERRFDHADVLDPDRTEKRHLAFGDGIHHCIGAPLARLEARVALEEFLKAFPDYQLGRPEVHHFTSLRGITSLLFSVGAGTTSVGA
jgi:cytochrome P450